MKFLTRASAHRDAWPSRLPGLALMLSLSLPMAALSPGLAPSASGQVAGASSTPPPADLIVDYVSDYRGGVMPCDCPARPLGGVARRATFYRRLGDEVGHRIKVAGGDFYEEGGDATQRLGGLTVLRALHRMSYDAVALGESDFAHGTARLLPALDSLPVVTTNLVWASSGKPIGQPMIVREYRGLPASGHPGKEFDVAVLSLLDDQFQSLLDFSLASDARKVRILPMLSTAREWVSKARKRADVVVVLLHQEGPTAAVQFARQVPGVDVVVSGHDQQDIMAPPRREGSAWIVNPGVNGRSVNELRITLGRDLRPASVAPRQVDLDNSWEVPGGGALAPLLAVYRATREVEGVNPTPFNRPIPFPPKWATARTCAGCHGAIVHAWSASPHAHALETLDRAGNHSEAACLQCHVLAAGGPDGFERAAPRPALAGVQCESCHGPGMAHLADPDKKGTIVGHPGPEVCVQCHDRKQDPKFDYAEAWARIKH